ARSRAQAGAAAQRPLRGAQAPRGRRCVLRRTLALAAMLVIGISAVPAYAQKAKPAKPAVAQAAEAAPLAYAGATVHTGTGDVISDATVVIAQGKIQQIGRGLAAPAGAEVISAKGMVITPGLVDALTSVGLVEVDLERDTHDDRQAGS